MRTGLMCRARQPRIAMIAATLFFSMNAVAQLPPPPPPSPNSPLPPPPPPSRGSQPQETREPRETREAPSRRETREVREAPPAARVIRPAPAPYVAPERDYDDAPRARTGFQIAARTGYAIPLGSLKDGAKMSDVFSGQLPLLVEAGAKITPNVFLGGYLGFGFGGASGTFKSTCTVLHSSCSASTFRIGVEAQYHFQPSERWNPWLGYGIGFESSTDGTTILGKETSVTFSGFEFAHLTAGLDYRINRIIGVGPVLDFSLGQYSHERDVSGGVVDDHDIRPTALHEWLTLGVRVTFLP